MSSIGLSLQPAELGEFVRGIDRVPRGVERVIKRPLAARHGARHGMLDHLAHPVILEEAAGVWSLVAAGASLGMVIALQASSRGGRACRSPSPRPARSASRRGPRRRTSPDRHAAPSPWTTPPTPLWQKARGVVFGQQAVDLHRVTSGTGSSRARCGSRPPRHRAQGPRQRRSRRS